MRRPVVALLMLGVPLLFSACALTAGEAGAHAERQGAPNTMNAQTIPDDIRRDAARRGAVTAEQVRVLAVETVTWRDGSLGCPDPDRLYTQALVPGVRYRVQAGAVRLVYHADRRGRWRWCPPERAEEPLAGPPT